MSAGDTWRPAAPVVTLQARARLNALIREFFARRGVLEVETPILSAAGTPDPNIQSLSLELSGPPAASPGRRWLRTSPEFALKRLLAAGIGDCYELGRVFRDGEAGRHHHPEFTLLEWYRVGWDHHALMDEVAALVLEAMAASGRSLEVERVGYRGLFEHHLGLDPHTAAIELLRAPLTPFSVEPAGLERDDWLDLLLSHLIQPRFPLDRLTLVHDFPASQCALARVRDGDPPLAERFEAFLGPLELANGFHELTDAGEQRHRFDADLARRRARGLPGPAIDARLLAALGHGLPDCAGVALGVDRLLMAVLGAGSIDECLAFPGDRA